MRFHDYYETLGVKPDASADEIKQAYRKLARKFHPDVSKEPKAEERFKEINEAYEALREPERRREYDRARAGGFRAGDEFRPGPGGGGFEYDFGDGSSQFSDFFESLFGRMRGGPRRGAGGREGPAETRAEFEIDLETAYAGGKQRVTVQAGRNTRTLEVKVPKGIASGQSIRLAGQGPLGPDGEPGDLLLTIRIRPHARFRLDGRDVSVELPIAPWEAALGGRVAVPTLGGEVDMAIPAGSQSGRKLRLKGRGLGSASAQGDQYVILQVHTPAADDARSRAAYEAFQAAFPGYDPRRR
jgi:curved DNA-binding protein